MFTLSSGHLLAAFARVPDPRRAHGKRFSLRAILALAVVAILSNHLSVLAIAQGGQRQSPALLAALGFPAGVTPHQTTVQRLFRKLDPLPLAAVLTAYFAPAPSPEPPLRGSNGVAFDGKAQRGRLACADHAAYPVHMLSAVLHDLGIVLAQTPLDHTGEKAEAELTAAPTLVARLDWAGRVMTSDALYCDRGCPRILVVTVRGGWRGRGCPCSNDCVPESVPPPPGRGKSEPYRVAMTTHHEARHPPPAELAPDRTAHGMEEENGARYCQLPVVRRD